MRPFLFRTTQERAALTQMQLEDLTKNRLDNATADAQQRAQEASDRASNVKASLGQIEANRIAEAEAQALNLKTFRAELRDSVWSGSRSVAVAPSPANSQLDLATKSTEVSNSSSSKQKKKPTKAESTANSAPETEIAKSIEVKESPKETPKPSGKIEQFVIDYVSQLSTNSSLLAVVNDRDTVRDLLAQGANTLKVDPSDILNTLLQMAEGSST